MERNIISWNITNWITVILMVAVGYTVIAAVVSLGSQWAGGSTVSTDASKSGSSLAA